MLSILIILLGLLVIGLASFGFSLFIIESPYFKWITAWLEKKESTSSFGKWSKSVIIKGLSCFTCQGFNWGWINGIWLYFVLEKNSFWTINSYFVIVLFFLVCACIGSAVSTLCSYFMQFYFDWRKGKGLDDVDKHTQDEWEYFSRFNSFPLKMTKYQWEQIKLLDQIDEIKKSLGAENENSIISSSNPSE